MTAAGKRRVAIASKPLLSRATSCESDAMDAFTGLGLPEAIATGLSSLGFAAPTPVQTQAIPALVAGRDILMESETGTGKTFAYLAPAMAICAEAKGKSPPLVLVAAPTQELAVQIGRESERLAKACGITLRSVVILGGTPLSRQAGLLHGGPSLLVGTLGRLADHVALGTIKTATLRLLVLDEGDRLLAPETEEAVIKLLSKVPRTCTRAIVSATLPKRARDKAAPFLRDPLEVAVAADRAVIAGDIEHWAFYCDGRKRLDFLRRLEAAIKPERCLVFLSAAARVESVAERLEAMGLPVACMQARLNKEDRRVALERFAEGRIRYLVTSDLGARGLDIQGLSHVVSLDLPEEGTVYIHRAGRTGRAGAKGISIVLADDVELQRASRLAVREGFVFRCKLLEGGEVLEPPTVEFFARVERAELEKAAHRERRNKADADAAAGAPRGKFSPYTSTYNSRTNASQPRTQSGRDSSAPEGGQYEARRGEAQPRENPLRDTDPQGRPEKRPARHFHQKREDGRR